jgi:hypothetical protein
VLYPRRREDERLLFLPVRPLGENLGFLVEDTEDEMLKASIGEILAASQPRTHAHLTAVLMARKVARDGPVPVLGERGRVGHASA